MNVDLINITTNKITQKQTVDSIGAEGAKMLSEALVVNTTLTELNLGGKIECNCANNFVS